MTRHSRSIGIILVTAAAAVLALTLGRSRPRPPAPNAATIASGGELLVSIRTEPRTFNRFAGRGETTELFTTLTQAKLVRVNRLTQGVEPWLAASWTRSADGLAYTLNLRQDIVFSDGHPFTSDDVLFSFAAVYDEKTGSPLADSLEVSGKRLIVAAPDPHVVAITFPSPFGPGLRLLDNLPILPRHKLQAALENGTLARAWGVTASPADIVGLGPFVIREYAPGQRVVLTRNPHYWRKDANGTPLPYLDGITLEIVSDQESEILRLESGQIDTVSSEVRPEDYAPLKRAADAGTLQLIDLGVAYEADSYWFNLKPGAFASDPRGGWLQTDELRLAISHGVDREGFANTVFLGAGVPVYGPITPANKKWYSPAVPRTPHDPARAKELLGSIGLADRNGDGVLEDARSQPARFTLVTVKGSSALERGAAVIRDDLKKIGLLVDVVALDQGAVVQRFLSGNYESVYFHVVATDTDPAINPDFWFSRGSAHVWNLEQKTPATEWERAIDELMTRQMASYDDAERKRLFDEVQQTFSEHLPVIYFVAPRVYVAASSRVTNLAPALTRPQLLWAADTIAVTGAERTAR